MKDTALAAVFGAIAGYFIHGHWAEIEWIVHILTR